MITTQVTIEEANTNGPSYYERQNAGLIPVYGVDALYLVHPDLKAQITKLHIENDVYSRVLMAYLKDHPVANGTEITMDLIQSAVDWVLEDK